MEATIFRGWIYDYLLPHAAALKVAHPLMLRAIAAAKKKNDRIDASKIADCRRCDFLPSATWLRPRFGSSAARCGIGICGSVKRCSSKNKIAVLLMEQPTITVATSQENAGALTEESALIRSLERDRLMTIAAVGPITALTSALEVGDVKRFSSIKKGVSFGTRSPSRVIAKGDILLARPIFMASG